MPSTKKLQAGVGSIADTLLKYVHPSALIREKYPNPMNSQRLENCLVICREAKEVKHIQQTCIIFHHNEFPDKELHCVERWVKIKKEGDVAQLFDTTRIKTPSVPTEKENGDGDDLPPSIFHATGVAEDIAMVRAQGIDVDDNNKLATENIPANGDTSTERQANGLYQGQEFGWDGVNHRACEGHHDLPATMKIPDIDFVSPLQFCYLFPTRLG